jgi:hypothetical protein
MASIYSQEVLLAGAAGIGEELGFEMNEDQQQYRTCTVMQIRL